MSRLVSANSDRTTGHRKEIAGFAPRKMYLPGTIFARSAQDDIPLAMLRSTLVFALACCAVADGQEAPKAFPPSLAVRPFTKPDFSSCGIPDPNKKVFVYVEMDVNPKGVPESVSLSRSSGNACVDRIALASAKKLRYLPPTRDGKPATIHTMIKAEF
jgi:TonB family protein